jgi:hypothetical protein
VGAPDKPRLNQRDFYTYWVVNSKRPNVESSVTVGYFGVNKHTAQLWDDDNGKVVGGAEFEGVEGILRRAHHIDQDTLRRFSSSTFNWAPIFSLTCRGGC